MKTFSRACWLSLLLPLLVAGEARGADAPAAESAKGWRYADIRRIPVVEARQGVAADGAFIYAISNHALGKYRKDTYERVGEWECPEGDPLIHLNAGIVYQGRLYCAHSNYPGVPNLSSVEIWDPVTMRHVGSHSFGRAEGSFTWLDRRDGHWVACFVHYAKKGGEPDRGPAWTRLVEFDDEWRQTGAWAFPEDLMNKLGARGYSVSGGAFGPGAPASPANPQVLCEPSQNGFSFDAPQRHSANGFFGTTYSAPVQSTNFTSSPSISSEPFCRTLIVVINPLRRTSVECP